jgi:hypothetical protein
MGEFSLALSHLLNKESTQIYKMPHYIVFKTSLRARHH